mgnify:CR=1 FL=1
MPSPIFTELPPPVGMDQRILAEQRARASYVEPPVSVRHVSIVSQGREVPARIYTAISNVNPDSILVWFHGGAFIGGSLDMPEAEVVSYELAHRTGAVVISVDYSLVTDDLRFPAPQQDGFAALRWAFHNAGSLGVRNPKVFVGGGSAGACLAGSVSLLSRDHGYQLAGVLPIYPVAHLAVQPFDAELRAVLPERDIEMATVMGQLHNPWLLGESSEAEQRKWHVFPGDTADVTGQAPFLFIQSELDALRATGQVWCDQLRAAGIAVEGHLLTGADHGFLNRTPDTDAHMARCLELMAQFISR